MNRAERLYRLHTALKGRRPPSLETLMKSLEISRATLKRDLAYMRDFMGAPIQYDRRNNGYCYDPKAPEFELPGLWFNDSELYALLASEQLLEAVQPGLLSPYIGPLKGRIRKLLEHSGHSSEVVLSRIRLQPMAQRLVDDTLFGVVSSAVLDEHCLNIEYEGRERRTRSQRRVHPHRLMHYRDNWYLIAWCEKARDYRTFSLDRIRSADLLDDKTHHVDEKALNRQINASFGIFSGVAEHWAVLRFNARRAQWVADENWHPDQIGQWRGEEYELQIPYSDERELLMDILKYGADVEVIAPAGLRQSVAQCLREAMRRYSEP